MSQADRELEGTLIVAHRHKLTGEALVQLLQSFGFHVLSRVDDVGGLRRELFAYAAKVVLGLFAIVSVWVVFGNPFRAREIHLRLVYPSDMKGFGQSTKLEYVRSGFGLFTPQSYTVFRKRP